jgi:hypothetical protein
MVPKKNGNMRMCIDFIELNKVCPKDPYPLPRIDIIIDQAVGCEMLSLLDCFSGYYQVWMRREDEAKIGFTTPFGIFCFVRMPKGLRNAGPTFNCMMKLILGSQLGRNASAYVDNIVIMSEKETDHIADLTETFDNMRRNGLKLNPEKCIFGIRKGQLLGCIVSKRGIQANPQKIPRCVLRSNDSEICCRRSGTPKFVNATHNEDWRAPIVAAIKGYYCDAPGF